MNEFIVWDKENNIFFDRESNFDKIYSKTDDEMYCSEEMYTNWVYYIFGFDILIDNNDRLTSHEYIGKTDIDNKKIYADCSIVNIEYFDYRHKGEIRATGYFTKNKEKHCLELVTERGERANFIEHISWVRSLKIIDTIQENKLGLIK